MNLSRIKSVAVLLLLFSSQQTAQCIVNIGNASGQAAPTAPVAQVIASSTSSFLSVNKTMTISGVSRIVGEVRQQIKDELDRLQEEVNDSNFKQTPDIKRQKQEVLDSSKDSIDIVNSKGGADSVKVLHAQEILRTIELIRQQEEVRHQDDRQKIMNQIEEIEKEIQTNEKIVKAKDSKQKAYKALKDLGKQLKDSINIENEKTKKEIKALGKAIDMTSKIEEQDNKKDLIKEKEKAKNDKKDGDAKDKKDGDAKDKKDGDKDKKDGEKDKKDGDGKDKKASEGDDKKKDDVPPSSAVQGAFVRVDQNGSPMCRVLPEDIKKYSTNNESALFEPPKK